MPILPPDAGGGGGGGSDPTFTTLTIGQVPKSNGSQLIYGGATVDPTTLEWTFDKAINVPSGSIRVSDTLSISEATLNLFIHDYVTNTNFTGALLPIGPNGTGALTVQEANSSFVDVAQPDDSQTLTTNPLTVPLLATLSAETDTFIIRTGAAMTNVRMTLTDNVSGRVLKYLPDKATVLAGSGGFNLRLGENFLNLNSEAPDDPPNGIFNFGFTPLRSVAGQATTFFIEADNMSILGNVGGIPYFRNIIHELFTTQAALIRDTSNISDNYIRINNEYTTASGIAGGIVANYQATATTDTVTADQFTAGVAATDNPTVLTDGSDTFAANDIIQISGTRLNNGFYEVADHTSELLTIRGVGTTPTVEGFSRDDFITTVDSGTITKINVSVLRAGSGGPWEEAQGSETPLSYTPVGEGSGNVTTSDVLTNNALVVGNDDTDVKSVDSIVAGTNALTFSGNSTITAPAFNFTLNNTAGVFDFNSIANNGTPVIELTRFGTEAADSRIFLGSNGPSGLADGDVHIDVRSSTTLTDIYMNRGGVVQGVFASIEATDTLAEVLANGNVTGGTDIIISDGDKIATNNASVIFDLAFTGSGAAIPISLTSSTCTNDLIFLQSSSADATTRELMQINNIAGANVTCLNLEQDITTGWALKMFGRVEHIESAATTQDVYTLNADGLTEGKALDISSNSDSTGGFDLLRLNKTSALATGSSALFINNQSPNSPSININGGGIVHAHTSTDVDGYQLFANNLLTGNGLMIEADALEAGGSIARLTSNSTNAGARNLIEVLNDNPLASSTTLLDLKQDADNTLLNMDCSGVTNSTALNITGLNGLSGGRGINAFSNSIAGGYLIANFEIGGVGSSAANACRLVHANGGLALNVAGRVFETSISPLANHHTINANTLTNGNALVITGDGLIAGSLISATSASSSTFARSLISAQNTNVLGTGAICLDLLQNANQNAVFIDAIGTTTDTAVQLVASGLTTGIGLLVFSDSPDDSTRQLVRIENENSLADGAICLDIQQDADTLGFRLRGDNNSSSLMVVDCDTLTSGNMVQFNSGSPNTAERDIVLIRNTNIAATGAECLRLQNISTGAALDIESGGIASQMIGGVIHIPTTIGAATYTLMLEDAILLIDHTSTAAVTITLPTAQTANGRKIVIKDSGGNANTNNITIVTEGAQTIDGQATLVLDVDYESITLISNGTNWFII